MAKRLVLVPYALAMVAIIIGVDLLFFEHRVWERLIANVGIVLVFVAFYWAVLRHL